jgi:hypothetical protein
MTDLADMLIRMIDRAHAAEIMAGRLRIEIARLHERVASLEAERDALREAVTLWLRFFDEMPKGQFGKIVCDIGLMNDAFIKSRAAVDAARVKPAEWEDAFLSSGVDPSDGI